MKFAPFHASGFAKFDMPSDRDVLDGITWITTILLGIPHPRTNFLVRRLMEMNPYYVRWLYRCYVHSGRRWKRIVQEIDSFESGIDRLTAAWQGAGQTGQERPK